MKAVNRAPFASSAEPHMYGCLAEAVRCIERRYAAVVLTVFCVMLTACGRHNSDFIAGGTVDMMPATAWYEADSLYRSTYRGADFINEGIDTLFGAYVTPDRGLVAYDSLYNSILFRSVVDTVAGLDLAVLTTYEDSLAFLINAYNVSVIYGIKRYGIIRPDQDGFAFFSAFDFEVAGRTLTLNGLEKNDPDLIARFDDPRIHFVLVCAALGCPPLLNKAYRAGSLYHQMDERTVLFINGTEFNPILGGGTTEISRIFQPSWYQHDFIGYTRNVGATDLLAAGGSGNERNFIAGYLAGADSTAKYNRIMNDPLSYDYDWSLNGQ